MADATPTADELDRLLKEMEGSRPATPAPSMDGATSEPVPEVAPFTVTPPEPKSAEEAYGSLLDRAERDAAVSWYAEEEAKAQAQMAQEVAKKAGGGGLGSMLKGVMPSGLIPDAAAQFFDTTTAPLAGIADKAVAAAKDIGTGLVTEPHKMIVGGAARGLNATTDLAAQAVDALAQWLDANVAKLSDYDQYLPDAMKTPVRQIDAEGHVVGPIPTEWAKPDTVTGAIGQGLAQFLTGFGIAGKVGGAIAGTGMLPAAGTGIGAEVARVMAQSAFANIVAFDGHEANLANLVEMVPSLQNPVTAYLASSPEDSDAVGRLKQALTGIVPDAGFSAFVVGLNALKYARRIKALTGEPTYEDAARKLETGLDEPGARYTGETEAEMLVGGADAPLWERAPLETGADPAFEAKGLSKTATEGEFKTPVTEMTPAERAAVAASRPRPVSVVEIGGPEKPPSFAWTSPSKRDTTPVGFGNHDMVARARVTTEVLAGKSYDIPTPVVDLALATVKRLDYAVPAGTEVGVLVRAEPGPRGLIRGIFRMPDGSDFPVLLNEAQFRGRRAFATADGTFIGLMRQGAAPNQLLRMEGEILHEIVHIAKIKGLTNAADWARLVAHGRSLKILGMTWADFHTAVGDTEIVPQLVAPQLDLGSVYFDLYHKRPDFKDLMDQEVVAHMLELEAHGYWKPGQMAPVADLVKQLKSGALAGKAAQPGAVGAAAGGAPMPAISAAVPERGLAVYHGSEFKFDSFDPEKIGRENGNTEGWGLYFSEQESGAGGYRANSTMADKTLPHTITIGGKSLATTKANADEIARLAIADAGATGQEAEAIRELVRTAIAHKEDFEWAGAAAVRAGEMEPAVKDAALAALKRAVASSERGHLYQATLGVGPEQMASWADPVAKQSPEHLAALRKLAAAHGIGLDEAAPFSKLYGDLAAKLGGKRAASEAMVKAGIPGVRYVGGPGPQTNYVLYDVGKVEHLSRDGEPLFAISAKVREGLDSLPESGTPKEMTDALLAKGLTEADLAMIGLRSAMEGRDTVTRDEIAAFFARSETEAKTAPPPAGTGPTYINLARIATPEDVKSVLQQMADAAREDGTVYGRGTRSNATTKEAAEQENAFKLLLGERKAGLPIAEEQLALRQLWSASASKLLEVSKLVTQSPTPERIVLFRRLMATHNLIQQEVIGIRTETARALQQWAIPSGAPELMAKQLGQMIDQGGGMDFNLEFAQRIAGLADKPGGMAVLDKLVKGGGFLATSRDMLYEAWRNGLLSSPTTHVVNIVSNAATLLTSMIERAVGGQISELTGNIDGVRAGEAMAMLWGSKQAMRDAFVFLAKNRRFSGMYSDVAGTAKGPAPYEMAPWNRKISRETMANSDSALFRRMAQSPMLGKAVDMLGSIVNAPGSAMMAADEFFKAVNDRAQLWALSYRQAALEAEKGSIEPEGIANRMLELILKPTAKMQMEAHEFAAYNTFTSDPGPITQKLLELRSRVPGAGMVLPFVATPANILKYSMERTPFAPLMSRFRSDVSAGGARRDMAIAKLGLGSMVITTAVDLGFSGSVTGGGPSDPGERAVLMRTGWKPYSLRIETGKDDDGKPTYRYAAYDRLDPVGYILGIGADLGEAMAYNGPEPDEDMQEAAIQAILGAAQSFTEKSYLTGFAGIVEALSDSKRYGEGYVDRTIASLVPSGVANVARQLDPYQKAVSDAVSALRARTPGLSASVPNRVDFWGRDIKLSSGLGWGFDMLTPVKVGAATKPEPIDTEMLRLKMYPTHPGSMVIEGVSIPLRNEPEAKRAWIIYTAATPASDLPATPRKRTADPITRYGDLTLLESLNAIISDKPADNGFIAQLQFDYAAATDDDKQDILQKVIRHYRSAAKTRVLDEFPSLLGRLKAQKLGVSKSGGASTADPTSPTLEP